MVGGSKSLFGRLGEGGGGGSKSLFSRLRGRGWGQKNIGFGPAARPENLMIYTCFL